jgi:hypothetical protein
MNKVRTSKYFLTMITTLVTLSLSLMSLFKPSIYSSRINQISRYELMGQDVVTVVISLIFLCVIFFADFNKIQTKILWLGCLLYQAYIYAYFSFGGITSIFYIIYIAITGLSLFLFLFILSDIIIAQKLPTAGKKYPRKSLSIFLFITVLIVTLIELQELIMKTIIESKELNPFYVFYVLDLAIIFPLIVIVSILNFKKAELGYLLSGVSLIKIITILPAVICNDLFHYFFEGYFLDLSFDIIALLITITGVFFLFFFLRNIENRNVSSASYNA